MLSPSTCDAEQVLAAFKQREGMGSPAAYRQPDNANTVMELESNSSQVFQPWGGGGPKLRVDDDYVFTATESPGTNDRRRQMHNHAAQLLRCGPADDPPAAASANAETAGIPVMPDALTHSRLSAEGGDDGIEPGKTVINTTAPAVGSFGGTDIDPA